MRLSVPLLLALVTAAGAADGKVDYARDIKPILAERCFACHGALKQNGKLRLDSGILMRKGGSSGPAVVPGKSAESVLFERVSDPDVETRMPPEGQPLTSDQLNTFRAWIDQGATFPADEQPESDPRDHWAFRSPVRPPIPTANPVPGRNPIDAFLAAEWQKRGLKPLGPVDKRLLLRRVYLGLIGLPPTAEQIDAFLKDPSPTAYEDVVNRLLESPQYGERWGRHYMDIWRYSDWWGLGAEVRNSQKHIWHWRDWIVESLNRDKGYDQMVREMLAADELYPTDPDKLRATGYLARQYFIFNRTTWLDETVEHTAKAFLGLTMNCTKCHDHKYDPISHADYYRFRSFFEPYQVRTDMVAGEPDYDKAGIPRAFDCNADAPTYRHRRGDDRQPIKSEKIVPGLPAVLGGDLKVTPVSLPPEAYAPHLRPFVEANYRKKAEARVAAARDAVAIARKAAAAARDVAKRPDPPAGKGPSNAGKSIAHDDFAKARPDLWDTGPGMWTHEKGLLRQGRPEAERSHLRLKNAAPADFEARFRFTITGGIPYRSVGLSFDVAGENEVMVYASAQSVGPKLQIAHKRGATFSYPAEGKIDRSIKVNETIELTVRVRGSLINVALNGEPAIAYRLPIARKTGAVDLVTYAATADFRSFELLTLPADVPLLEPQGAVPKADHPEQARLALELAEKSLAVAEAELPVIEARFAAERSKHARPPGTNRAELARAAARAEKSAGLRKAEESLARAELELVRSAPAQKAAAEKKRDAARNELTAAKKALDHPGDSYTAPQGALKTRENNLETEPSRNKPFPMTSTGRRSALANWIADAKNPLAARVAVNHVWARHFGRPLVSTVFDFGRKGAKPSHPELLDWLAVEFMENDWSLKHLHRLLVTSVAYRRTSSSSGADPETIQRDGENVYLWRMNSIRMESQVVRDSMLHLAGQLDLAVGGPSISTTAQSESKRRSLYFVHSHNDHHRFLMQFDDAAVLECYRRTESIVPQQALTLSNSKFALSAADAIAARIQARLKQSSDTDFVDAAFEMVLGVTPTTEERKTCLDALTEWQKVLTSQKNAAAATRARVNLVAALLNHNDYVTVR